MNKVVEYMAMGCALVSFDLHEARVTAQDAAVYAFENDEAQFAKLIVELRDHPPCSAPFRTDQSAGFFRSK
jgi:hypothetical protein